MKSDDLGGHDEGVEISDILVETGTKSLNHQTRKQREVVKSFVPNQFMTVAIVQFA